MDLYVLNIFRVTYIDIDIDFILVPVSLHTMGVGCVVGRQAVDMYLYKKWVGNLKQ